MDKHACDCVKIDKKMMSERTPPFFQFQTTYPLPHAVVFSKPYSSWGVTNGALEEWRVRKYYETSQSAPLVLLGNRMFFAIDRILNNGIIIFYHDQWPLRMINPPPKVTPPMILSFSQNYAINSVQFVCFLNFQDFVNFQSR